MLHIGNLRRFFPEKAATLALELLKELVEVIEFNNSIYSQWKSFNSDGFLITQSRF